MPKKIRVKLQYLIFDVPKFENPRKSQHRKFENPNTFFQFPRRSASSALCKCRFGVYSLRTHLSLSTDEGRNRGTSGNSRNYRNMIHDRVSRNDTATQSVLRRVAVVGGQNSLLLHLLITLDDRFEPLYIGGPPQARIFIERTKIFS